MAETDTSGNTKNEYVYFAGQRISWWDGAAPQNLYYIYSDALGSTRTIAEANGTTCYDSEFTPYGEELNHTNTCPSTYNHKFTGYERDSETGLDYAFARYYSSRLGRFMSPDPLGGDVDDPQSLNRYAYVLNNPGNFIDPYGLRCYAGEGCNPENEGGWASWGTPGFSVVFADTFDFLGYANPPTAVSFSETGGITVQFDDGSITSLSQAGQQQGMIWSGYEDPYGLLLLTTFSGGGGGAGLRLVAKSVCATSTGRTISYKLETTSGGSPSQQYNVIQQESNPNRTGNSPFGPNTSFETNNKFADVLRPGTQQFFHGPDNSIQTFYISPMGAPASPTNMMPVLVRDSAGNDYSALGAFISLSQILVNGKAAPSLAPCP